METTQVDILSSSWVIVAERLYLWVFKHAVASEEYNHAIFIFVAARLAREDVPRRHLDKSLLPEKHYAVGLVPEFQTLSSCLQ